MKAIGTILIFLYSVVICFAVGAGLHILITAFRIGWRIVP